MTKISKDGKPRESLTTKFKRVYSIKRSSNFQAVFKFKGKHVYVGVYDSAEKAAIAADFKCVAYGIPAERLNFPEKYSMYKSVLQVDSTEERIANFAEKSESALSLKVPEPARRGRVVYCGGFAQKCRNKLGFKGVYKMKNGTYYAVAYANKKTIRIDQNFETLEEAAKCFDFYSVLLGRGPEYLNFPNKFEDYKRNRPTETKSAKRENKISFTVSV